MEMQPSRPSEIQKKCNKALAFLHFFLFFMAFLCYNCNEMSALCHQRCSRILSKY